MAMERTDTLPDAQWQDATLRQVVRVSLTGQRLRIRVSNAFGTAPLARPGVSHAIVLIGVNDLGGQRRKGEDTPEARQRLVMR